MSLSRALAHLGFITDVDFVVQDDGNGPYIKAWTSAEPKPDEATILDAQVQFLKLRLTTQVKDVCGQKIYARYPIHKQLNGEANRDWIDAMRARCAYKEGEIDALIDVAACDGYNLQTGWPD